MPGYTGNLYGFAEAARTLARYEPFFIEGEQLFAGAALDKLLTFDSPPPDHGALRLKNELLLLTFNETGEPYTPEITIRKGRKIALPKIDPYWYLTTTLNL